MCAHDPRQFLLNISHYTGLHSTALNVEEEHMVALTLAPAIWLPCSKRHNESVSLPRHLNQISNAGQAMLAMSDTGALLRFVQRPHAVDLEEGSAALRAAGRYSELVALLQGRGLHEPALGLLQTMSQAPASLAVAPQGGSAAADIICPGLDQRCDCHACLLGSERMAQCA